MKKPIITWYAKLNTDTKFTKTDDLYAGTYTPDSPIQVNIQVWNNRWGTTDTEDLTDFAIHIYFEQIEDNSLFDYCTIVLNESDILNINKSGNIGVLEMPNKITLSGVTNDGTAENNKDNYMSLDFTFKVPENISLKEKDLKSLFFEIINL